jgi:hypothetical protein
MPGTLVDWESYLAWHYNHGAVLVAINMGATGNDLPAQLQRSAFSPQALVAYHRFLEGERLREKPVSADPLLMRIQRKMRALQEGFHRWQEAGRDPAPIGRFVEERLPALLHANRLSDAEALLDEALKRLKAKDLPDPAFFVRTQF